MPRDRETGSLTFLWAEVAELVQLARTCSMDPPLRTMYLDRGILLVGSDGVHLSINQHWDLDGPLPPVVYPRECDPARHDFDQRWQVKEATFGGSDGTELLSLEYFDRVSATNPRYFVITFFESEAFELSAWAEAPRRTAPALSGLVDAGLFPIGEVVKAFGIGRARVKSLAARGLIHPVRDGRAVLFDAKEIRRLRLILQVAPERLDDAALADRVSALMTSTVGTAFGIAGWSLCRSPTARGDRFNQTIGLAYRGLQVLEIVVRVAPSSATIQAMGADQPDTWAAAFKADMEDWSAWFGLPPGDYVLDWMSWITYTPNSRLRRELVRGMLARALINTQRH